MIREIRTGDRDDIVRLIEATNNFSEAEIEIAKELIDICIEQSDQQDYSGYVAEVDERIAGFLIFGPTPATLGTYDMYWIAVDPEYQGRGVAQDLDEFIVQFVQERGGYLIVAETSSQPGYERTRAFYAKQGYTKLAQVPEYYKPGDDLIIFGKRV
jgi:ribosomal protein S18 acetylase RimI-like enzyme